MDHIKKGPEFQLDKLLTSLTKKEAVAVREELRQLSSKEGRLILELYDAIRYSRSQKEDGLVHRLKSAELIKYLSYYKGRLREHVLATLAKRQRDTELRNMKAMFDEMGKCWTLHAKGFKDEAIERIERFANGKEMVASPYLKLILLEEQHRILRASGAAERFARLGKNHARKAAQLDIIGNMETTS